MKRFYYIQRVRTYINVMQISTVFFINGKWTINLQNGKKYEITENEFADLKPILEAECEPKKEGEKQE